MATHRPIQPVGDPSGEVRFRHRVLTPVTHASHPDRQTAKLTPVGGRAPHHSHVSPVTSSAAESVDYLLSADSADADTAWLDNSGRLRNC
jgi:hypothetical protein